MKVRFTNGVTKECAAPTEQKAFKSGVGAGWILILRLLGNTTSAEFDELMTPENVSSLEFLAETENGEDKPIFTLSGYDKITSSTIRHAEDTKSTTVEIQLTKGI